MERQDDTENAPGTRPEPGARYQADRFRELMSRFPTGVSVVTTTDAAGRPQGATCSSLASVTLFPPTLLVCLTSGGTTLEAIGAGGRFAVNLLHDEAQDTARAFAAPLADRFAGVPWKAWASSGPPYLYRDAFAFADCRVTGQLPVGDHVIVLGAVTRVHLAASGVPLVYGMRRFLSCPPAVTADSGC